MASCCAPGRTPGSHFPVVLEHARLQHALCSRKDIPAGGHAVEEKLKAPTLELGPPEFKSRFYPLRKPLRLSELRNQCRRNELLLRGRVKAEWNYGRECPVQGVAHGRHSNLKGSYRWNDTDNDLPQEGALWGRPRGEVLGWSCSGMQALRKCLLTV